MNEKRPDSQGGGMSLGDIYFILFRQKWIILTFSLLGIVGAVVLLFVVKPPQYQSEAMISIRYVVEGKSSESSRRPCRLPGRWMNGATVSSIRKWQFFTALIWPEQVVQAMTPERILAKVGGGTNINRAAALVKSGLTVEQIPESSVIRITFQNPDPTLVQPILSEIIDAYLMKHVQLHQGLGVSDCFSDQ